MPELSKVAKIAVGMVLAAAVLMYASCQKSGSSAAPPAPPSKPGEPRVIELSVTEEGFEPTPIHVKKGEPLKLRVTRRTEKTCATELLIKDTAINTPLPLNQTVEILYTPEKTGKVKYGCAMGMMISGVLLVE